MLNGDESSQINPHVTSHWRMDGTPNRNKRPRTKSFENEANRSPELQSTSPRKQIQTEKKTQSKHMTSSSQENDCPPISLKFKREPQSSDRQILNEFITWWKSKHSKDLNIIGRFGYNKNLLVFAKDIDTFDVLVHKPHWPKKILEQEYEMKLPRIFPAAYSIVIKQFPRNWDELETAEEMKEKYPALIKLTRMYGRNDTVLNSIRADFQSLHQVQMILQDNFISISPMRLPVKKYYLPVRVMKCMRCFSHEHPTTQCSNQRVCIRCGQQHPLINNCPNEIKCVNCQQSHYAGHASCPIVQQKRRQFAEQQKINRSNLLINASEQHYQLNQTDFPLPTCVGGSPPGNPNNYSTIIKQRSDQSQQTSLTKKEASRIEHLEQTLLSRIVNLEARLSSMVSNVATQLTDIEVKIDKYSDRLDKVEHDIYEIIIPAIQTISQIASSSTKTGKVKQQLSEIIKSLTNTRQGRQWRSDNPMRYSQGDTTQQITTNEYDQ